MPGIYIHIPFCKQACHYCDFHFSTSLKNKAAFVEALKMEIALRKGYLTPGEVKTIYFGGGTPSLLTQKELLEIFATLNRHFTVAVDAEITLEANPDDLSEGKIKELKETPVNRLSIGIQSFSEDDLRYMNRAHNSDEAARCVKLAQEAGFDNITIDLIYGTPTMDDRTWRKNLAKAFDLGVKHISAYGLTVEKGTALDVMIGKGKTEKVDDQKCVEQFLIMCEEMEKHGFIQYEISNFCKPGFESKHNSNYWKQEHYLGLGPSAHSFNGISRQWNVVSNSKYIASLQKGEINCERELLSIEDRYNEYILTALRTIDGIDLDHVEKTFGKELLRHCLDEIKERLDIEEVLLKENKLILSTQGKLMADRIASDLFKTK